MPSDTPSHLELFPETRPSANDGNRWERVQALTQQYIISCFEQAIENDFIHVSAEIPIDLDFMDKAARLAEQFGFRLIGAKAWANYPVDVVIMDFAKKGASLEDIKFASLLGPGTVSSHSIPLLLDLNALYYASPPTSKVIQNSDVNVNNRETGNTTVYSAPNPGIVTTDANHIKRLLTLIVGVPAILTAATLMFGTASPQNTRSDYRNYQEAHDAAISAINNLGEDDVTPSAAPQPETTTPTSPKIGDVGYGRWIRLDRNQIEISPNFRHIYNLQYVSIVTQEKYSWIEVMTFTENPDGFTPFPFTAEVIGLKGNPDAIVTNCAMPRSVIRREVTLLYLICKDFISTPESVERVIFDF